MPSGGLPPRRPDQRARPAVPLSPTGLSVAQLIQQGLLTNADMIALGLAKDSSVQDVNSTAAGTTAAVAAVPGQVQLMGAPPYVLNIASVNFINEPASTETTIFTFPSDGRIWTASLSFAIATEPAYSGGGNSVSARIRMGVSLIYLAIVELAIGDAGVTDSGVCTNSFNGISVASGDTIQYDINLGTSYADAVMRASGFVLYSIP
jgi:hypothetical protein